MKSYDLGRIILFW